MDVITTNNNINDLGMDFRRTTNEQNYYLWVNISQLRSALA